MHSSMSSFDLKFIIFLKEATLGFGKDPTVIDLSTSFVISPDILITATPDKPGPEDSA